LQAAKDREIAELSAKITSFESQLAAKVSELGEVNAALSAEKELRAKVETDLAATGERLSKAEAAHATLVGGVLGGAPDKALSVGPVTGLARMVAAAENEKK
jgi:uncharacterized coiled-coil protein SlyX